MSETTDATAYSNARFGQGMGDIFLDNVRCVGTETMLGDCPANPIGSHNCVHNDDAGVGCQGTGNCCAGVENIFILDIYTICHIDLIIQQKINV